MLCADQAHFVSQSLTAEKFYHLGCAALDTFEREVALHESGHVGCQAVGHALVNGPFEAADPAEISVGKRMLDAQRAAGIAMVHTMIKHHA